MGFSREDYWSGVPYAEYILQNAGLDDSQAGIRISGRNINNLRYADNATLSAKSEEKLKRLLMKVQKRMKKNCLVDLKFSISKPTRYKIHTFQDRNKKKTDINI